MAWNPQDWQPENWLPADWHTEGDYVPTEPEQLKHLNIIRAVAQRMSLLEGVSVYAHKPEKVAYPFVDFGDFIFNTWATDDSVGADVTLTIRIHSTYRGKKQLINLQDAIRDLMGRRALEIDDAVFISSEWLQDAVSDDGDGKTGIGTSTYRILVDQSLVVGS